MSSATAKIDLNISEGMIANAIAVAIAESFSDEKKDQIIRDIVRANLAHKENSYDRETMLSKAVGAQIKTMAADAVREKVASMKDDVDAVVDRTLGPQFREAILKQLADSLARLTVANISLSASVVMDN